MEAEAPCYRRRAPLLRHCKERESGIIDWYGQTKYTAARGFQYYAGYRAFGEAQFQVLIRSCLAAPEAYADGTVISPADSERSL